MIELLRALSDALGLLAFVCAVYMLACIFIKSPHK